MRIFKTIAIASALFISISAAAIPAKRIAYVKSQPDGSTVTLTMVGDEYYHYYLTDDEQIVVKNGDAYYFAKVGEDGRLEASNVLAADAAKRNEAQITYVNRLSDESLREAIVYSRENSPLMTLRNAHAEREGLKKASSSENYSYGVGRRQRDRKYPVKGKVKSPIFLVEYQDVPFTRSDEEIQKYFKGLLMTPGFSEEKALGSAWDYFNDASKGQFDPQFDVYGPVKLPNPRAYYGKNTSYLQDETAYLMVVDAAEYLASQGVDFSEYDNDKDGIVDNVFVFYAGNGEADTGISDYVWPHQINISALVGGKGYKIGDVYLDNYACANEISYEGVIAGIGTFCHEYSHVLGLPDLYDITSSGDYTPGNYDLMDVGSYNGESRVPPTYSIFERNAMGWADIEVIDGPADITLENLIDSNKGYVVLTSDPNEFFLLENRQQEKDTWDYYIPGHGMLIWHITYNNQRWEKNIVNTIANKQYVDLVEACGKYGSTSTIKKRYPFPGTGRVRTFDGFTTWKGETLPYPLTDITETDGVITFKVAGGQEAGLTNALGEDVKVSINGREITVDGANNVEVYDLLGRNIAKGNHSIMVPASGIYLIQADGKTTKIAVK